MSSANTWLPLLREAHRLFRSIRIAGLDSSESIIAHPAECVSRVSDAVGVEDSKVRTWLKSGECGRIPGLGHFPDARVSRK